MTYWKRSLKQSNLLKTEHEQIKVTQSLSDGVSRNEGTTYKTRLKVQYIGKDDEAKEGNLRPSRDKRKGEKGT